MRHYTRFLRLIETVLLAAGVCILGGRFAAADDLATIKRRGVLVVGVKADYPPFGFRMSSGEITGIEPALAAEVAKSLGVRLELAPVLPSNRIEMLQDGKIDLIIATMNDTMVRRHQVDIVKPYYYASGYNVMLPKSTAIAVWADLKGRTLCVVAGAYYNEAAATNFQFQVRDFVSVADALAALKDGRCEGLLYDDAAIEAVLPQPAWSGYAVPLESREVQPWGLAVRKDQPDWAAYLSGMVNTWIKDGTIQELETTYHINHSKAVQDAHQKASSGPR